MVDSEVKVTRSYSTKGSKNKILEDAMKANKTSTMKLRRLKKTIAVEEKEDIKVVEVEGGEDINSGVVATTKERKKEGRVAEKTRSSKSKSSSHAGMRKKHIAIKKRKHFEGPGPKKRIIVVKKLSSSPKKIKTKKEIKDVAREQRNKILMTRKVLLRSTFYPKIYEKPGMIELVEYVRHQC